MQSPPASIVALFVALSPAAAAQSFQTNQSNIPTVGPNQRSSENVDFADIDSDGDWDAIIADGGDDGNYKNRIWINRGGLQGGTVGVFVDDTSSRSPNTHDTSRDVEFADIDGDGDLDWVVANTSSAANQASRWLVNQGGAQGGTEGFFVDETSTRWVGIGQAGSSVAASRVLGSGGWITYASDIDFGDFDADGDVDAFVANVGQFHSGGDPSLVFLNDGTGHFTEFNPSGFQLDEPGFILHPMQPALWCEGKQQHKTLNTDGTFCDIATVAVDADLGDLDGDLDLDILQGDRNDDPRVFYNRLEENGGALSFRDMSGSSLLVTAVGGGNYEQELGDFDGDDDLDFYALNWGSSAGTDLTYENDGAGVFTVDLVVPSSGSDDEEADFFDYDGDGDLDVYVSNFSGQDRLYENEPGIGFTNFTSVAAELPPGLGGIARDSDAADVDGDGDYDLIVCQDNFVANILLENITQVADTYAPRVANLESVPDRSSSTVPTRVRAQVYDNAAYYTTWYNATALEYSVDGGAWQSVAMTSSGGQVFRGTIPGELSGTIEYRVSSADEYGNTGVSGIDSYVATCDGELVNYCTAGTSSNGCSVVLAASGVPSATAASGFTLSGPSAPGQINGLVFYGTAGRLAQAWGSTSSYKCVAFPSRRTQLLASGGTSGACDGTFSVDLNARWTAKPLHNPGAGAVVDAQLWYRDAGSAGNPKTAFSDGAEFVVCP
jgi:hypothetical protein